MISTPINYTCTNLAAHLKGVSHDAITDYLSHARLTARQVWEVVQRGIQDSPEAFLIVDDSVQDKRSSQKIELVKRQYSGTQRGMDRLYVHCPDRFARNYAYQVLLLEELTRVGVNVIFRESPTQPDSLSIRCSCKSKV